MSRSVFRRLASVFVLSVIALVNGHAAECPDSYDFGQAIDYYDPDPVLQARIRGIESNHMNQNVRSLQRGQSTASAAGDLRFVIAIVPNHPEALGLLMRLALMKRTDRLPEAQPYTVECWLHRATVFSPNDGTAFVVYGIYLARTGKVDKAISALERASTLKPDDTNVTYNLGLMYFEKKDYERSRENAKKAYDAGFPLPGLKNKLQQAGQWRD
jgi:tetratricopeptide (TPR) repeat protein